MMERMHWQDWITVLLGTWLFVSPWALGFTEHGGAMWNAILLGAAIVALAIADVYFPDPWPERVNLMVGVWVAISPMALGFTGETLAMFSTAVTGALVVLLAAWTDWAEWHKSAPSH